MNLLFIQGGSRWKYDSEGTLYTDPNFNSQIWSRYKGYCDELTVVLRREDRIYTKEEARIKFNEIGNLKGYFFDEKIKILKKIGFEIIDKERKEHAKKLKTRRKK